MGAGAHRHTLPGAGVSLEENSGLLEPYLRKKPCDIRTMAMGGPSRRPAKLGQSLLSETVLYEMASHLKSSYLGPES